MALRAAFETHVYATWRFLHHRDLIVENILSIAATRFVQNAREVPAWQFDIFATVGKKGHIDSGRFATTTIEENHLTHLRRLLTQRIAQFHGGDYFKRLPAYIDRSTAGASLSAPFYYRWDEAASR